MSDECIFCKIASGQMGTEYLYEDEHLVAFPDINAQAPTHVLLIPRRHIAQISEMDQADQELAGRLIIAANQIATKLGLQDGYRLVFNCGPRGGQAVYHVHLHLLGGRQMNWPPG